MLTCGLLIFKWITGFLEMTTCATTSPNHGVWRVEEMYKEGKNVKQNVKQVIL